MGVVFAKFADDDRIISIAKNIERNLVATDEEGVTDADAPAGAIGTTAAEDAVPNADSGKVETPNE
jgi:DNA gyrase subunit A